MNSRKLLGSALLIAGLAACGDGGTGPSDNSVSVAVQSGDAQFGGPSAVVLDPLQVVVTDPVSKDPLENIEITWQVVSGNGALVTPALSTTNENGVATATLRLGSTLGTYEVEARAARMVGGPARFVARAVTAPVISSAPPFANGGDTITLTGSNFSPQGDDNLVLFGGFRGKVVSATTTQLRVVVPTCVPARIVQVSASLGAVTGAAVPLEVRGNTTSALQLARGEARTFSDPAELGCFQLPGGVSGYQVVLIPQNASDVAGTVLPVQLAGLSAGGALTSIIADASRAPNVDLASSFEMKLRARERQLIDAAGDVRLRPQPSVSAAACPTPAQVGNTCTFQVIDKNDEFVTVTAVLKAISARALIYQDNNAPANGLSTADFQSLGASFDDPIYSAVSSAFGNPSDLDGNGKVIILLTPIVNAMTARGSSGFIAGFFYGCDLVAKNLCSGTNSAEIFYTMTADPTGQFSDARSVTSVLRSLLPVLGHEFQHMIGFGQRKSTDALWLSEGLAHHAEDVVADVYQQRGDVTNATLYRSQNYLRASRYLRDPSATSLIAEGGTGTLELRGAAWLFVKYLAGQHGPTVLRNLTQSSQSSVTNVEQQTGKSWSSLLANWSIALYADDAPELVGATVRPEHVFPNIDLRATIRDAGTYALRPITQTFADFIVKESLPASSQSYVRVQAGSNSSAMSLNLAGQLGGAFGINAAPQLSILRLQ